MQKEIKTKTAIPLLLAIVVVVAVGVLALDRLLAGLYSPVAQEIPLVEELNKVKDFQLFSSEDDFKDYLSRIEALADYYGAFGVGLAGAVRISMVDEASGLSQTMGVPEAVSKAAPDRISETNVQTAGIDEPDIVKTDGENIYFSPASYYWRGAILEGVIVPPQTRNKTKIVQAFPPADLEVLEEIDKQGNLLLKDDILVVFSGQEITGFDISDPEKPEEKWQIELDEKSYLVGARLKDSNIYLVTKQSINHYSPCPIRPLVIDGKPLEVACNRVYHPLIDVPVDITYTALMIDVKSGRAEKDITFVGSSGNSILYVSDKAIYATYNYYQDPVKFMFNFFEREASDLVPSMVRKKIERLNSYDISLRAKMTEMEIILEQFEASLSDDERMKFENEIENRMSDYYKEYKRELEKTGIVKIALSSLNVRALGTVAGRPLNQFSLDEFEDNLRIATTIGGRGGFFLGSWGESESDVYVLNSDLEELGSVKGLGLTERIYAVRFLGSKGYVVTFRETDPFYVLDLADPTDPQVKGELKIPGYSSYLHPITDNEILGIGKEGSKVKLSLFDVSDPQEPKEAAKYILSEYWSDVLNTHHAFLLDEKHKIFFLPGSRGGYIFSYQGGLSLERAVSGIMAKRAVYLDDYLYVIGDDEIIVLSELDWKEVNSLKF